MQKKNKFLLSLCVGCVALSSLAITSCVKTQTESSNNAVGSSAEELSPLIQEGYLDTFQLGASAVLNEYFVFDGVGSYTMKAVLGDMVIDLTGRAVWTPEVPGVYTLTYTVTDGPYEGTASIDLTVKAYDISWQYSQFTGVYQVGETMQYADFFERIFMEVSSYFDYELYMKQVVIGNDVTDLTGTTSYTFVSSDTHIFTMAVKTEDGQSLESTAVVEVQYTSENAKAWCEQNDVVLYKHIKMDNQEVLLGKGTYAGEYTKNDIPYIAYEGEYGLGSYVTFDFTGSNLPQLAFFQDKLTPSFTDGEKGILISNGITRSSGAYCSDTHCGRLTIYGPYKAQGTSNVFEAESRLFSTNYVSWKPEGEPPATIARSQLEENRKYRYIVGFQKGAENGSTVILQMLLADRSTGEIIYQLTQELNPASGHDCKPFVEGYFTGSITAYGSFGLKTKFDAVYPVKTGVGDISELMSEFKENDTERVLNTTVLNVSDFVDTSVEYKFGYVSADGVRTDVTGETFTIPTAGEYTLVYENVENGCCMVGKKIAVFDKPWYEVRHYLPDYAGDETLYQTAFMSGAEGTMTAATALDIFGFTGKTIEQVAIAGDCSTIVNVYYTRNNDYETFEAVNGKNGLSIVDATNTDVVEVIKKSNGENAIRFYRNTNTNEYFYVKIKLSDGMLEKIADGDYLTFYYALSRMSSSQYLTFDVFAGSGAKQVLASDITATYNSSVPTGWAQLMITDVEVLAEIVQNGELCIGIQAKGWAKKHHTNLWIDDLAIVDALTYTVVERVKVAEDNFVEFNRYKLSGFENEETKAKVRDVAGMIAPTSVTQGTIAADETTVVYVDYTLDELVQSFDFISEVDGTKYYFTNPQDIDTVTLSEFGYGESQGDATDTMNKSLLFHMGHTGTNVGTMTINAVLSDAQKAQLESGVLSFSYAINRLSSSAYTVYDVTVGANGGTVTQKVVEGAAPSFDSLNNRGPLGAWTTVTVTDMAVLAELAEKGILQITITATDWQQRHETNLWIDNIKVETAATYTVKHYVAGGLVKTETMIGKIGSETIAKELKLDGYETYNAKAFNQATILADGTTVVEINYEEVYAYDFNEYTVGNTADAAKFYFTDAEVGSTVSVSTYGSGEFHGKDTDAENKSIVFYLNHTGSNRADMIMNVVLSEAMKARLNENGVFTFTYAINRCVSSAFFTYDLFVGASGGSIMLKALTGDNVGWDPTNGTYGPVSSASDNSAIEQWQTVVITDATVLNELASTGILQIKVSATNWAKRHHTTFFLDDVQVREGVEYTVEHYLGNNLIGRDVMVGVGGMSTEAKALDVDGLKAGEITQATILEDGSTVVRIEYTLSNPLLETFDFVSEVDGTKYSIVDAKEGDTVTISEYGYGEYQGDATNAINKALKFYITNATERSTVTIKIVLSEAQKEQLANGGILSFGYVANRCKSSAFQKLEITANGQVLVTDQPVGWDATDGTAGPTTSSSWEEAVAWQTVTITDAALLSALATSGELELVVNATGWSKRHQTNLWIDNLEVEAAVAYKVEHKFGDTVLKTENLMGVAGTETTAKAIELDGLKAGEITQATILEDGSTVVRIEYTLSNPLLETFDFVSEVDGTKYSIVDAKEGDTVTISEYGYGEYQGDATNAINKALKFYITNATERSTVTIKIALSEAQKEQLANGGILSFGYVANRCVSSAFQKLEITANGQVLVTDQPVGWDSSAGTAGPTTSSSWQEAVAWQTVTITDATLLSALATSGELELVVNATGWSTRHQTNLWIDNLEVTPAQA